MAQLGAEIGTGVSIWVIEHSGKWGYRKMLKLMTHKIFPAIQNRVKITIPNDAAYVKANCDKSVEFFADVSNPNPLDMTIYETETTILYQDTLLGFDMRHAEINVPKETSMQRIALAIYYPLSNLISLPAENRRWQLRAKIYLRCYYGTFERYAENLGFSITGDYQAAKQKLSETIKSLRDGI
jgi:hypothetical protein